MRCHVCGLTAQEAGALFRQNRTGRPGIWACHAHRQRIRCSIDGCTKTHTSKHDHGGAEEWICSVHWRRHCPPRSLRRRTYHRFFRIAKRHGWSERLADQYWRFWDLLLRLANKAEKSDAIDMSKINKLFGWDQ